MENKEEIIQAIDYCVSEYEKSLNMEYAELREKCMYNGVCYKLSRTTWLSKGDIKFISEIGAKYVKENKIHLKKLFPLCFKRSEFKMNLYWCNLTPQISLNKEQMTQSLAIRFYILNEIRQIVQFL